MQKFTKLFVLLVTMFSFGLLEAQLSLPITYDDPIVTYTMTDFDGGTTTLMANPFPTGINTTTHVLQMIKNSGQVWAGSKLTLSTPLDFTVNNTFKMKVYSPRVNCPVLFKLEGAGGVNTQVSVNTTVANDWEELTWDFTGATSGIYTDLVFIYDLGVMGDGSSNFTFYQDEIQFVQTLGALNQIDLPVTFDVANTDYTMTDFGGTVTAVAADPLNAANMVGMTIKDATAQTWAGTTMGTGGLGFANAIPFTATNRKMTVAVYSPIVGASVKLKVEVAGQPTQSVETDQLTTVANAWETLTFDFDAQSAGTAAFNTAFAYDMASIFFDFGNTGTSNTFYFDDVMMYMPTGPAQIDLPVTFDVANVDYTMTDFGGTVTAVSADPMNAANMVGMTLKDATAQTWAGTTMGTNGLGFANAIPFTATNRKMTVAVYSPIVGASVKLKVEVAGQPTQSVETDQLTTVANAWETLTFDFDAQSAGTAAFNTAFAYNMASIFFDFGNTGTTNTFYFDDVMMYMPTGPAQIDLPVTFDVANVDYTMTDFGGTVTAVAADPMNAANMVGMTVKDATAQTWAGTTMGTGGLGFANAIPFTATNRKMTVAVYSPIVGASVKLKVEVAGQPTQSVETDQLTTVANAWETLTFDFDAQSAGTAAFNTAFVYDMASIFFDFGNTGTTNTFYFDDVMMGPVVLFQIDLPVTFDVPNVDYTMTDFGGTVTALAADPMNAANMVGMTIKDATAQTWAGTTMGTNNVGFANAIPFTATNRKMTVAVYSPIVGASVKLKVEVAGQPTQSVETDQLTTVANAWETLTFDFDAQSSGTAAFNTAFAYDMASIFFDFGNTGTSNTFYFDDVMMYMPTGPAQIDLPVTFDVANVDYTMTDFGGTVTAVAADPMNAANMVGMTIKDATAQTWAGTTMGTGGLGFANAIPFTATNRKMTVAVYSPIVGASVKLKVEVAGQPTQSVETDQLTTVANAWETLTFDFDAQSSGTAAFNTAFAYNMASIFFDFGNTGTSNTFYFDDVMMYMPTGPAQIDLPVTFDVANVDYTMTDFGGTVTAVAADPLNAANMVGMTVKDATAATWAGTTMGTNGLGFANAIPFTATNRKMTVAVYSPIVGASVKLKVEVAGQPTQSVETDQLTTVANAWEILTFDFDAQSSGTAAFNTAFAYDMASIFFDFGNTGTSNTFYFDDVMMYMPTGPAQIDLPVTFDVANVDYTMTDFGGTVTAVAADPMNAANMVGMTVKDATAATWAGTTMGTNGLGFANVIPFTATNRKMTVAVYSPIVGASVKLKVEVAGQPTQSVETDQLTTVANAWETLTFDFDAQSAGTAAFNTAFAYDMASIFFDFGNTGTTNTFYFDDVMMFMPTGPSQIDLPVTFDVANVDYTMTDFGGNASVLGADPVNPTNTVAVTEKTSGAQTWAGTTIGTNLGFANVIPFTATNRKMTVRVYSPDAGIQIRLKAEVHGQPAQSVETEATTTTSNAWETLVFDFNNQAAGTAAFNATYPYDMASIFFDFGTAGAAKTYYFDDVMMDTTGGGTGPILSQIDLPVTFEDTTVNYTMTDFGGNASVLGADPVNPTNTVAVTEKTAGAQTWAGTTIGTNLGFANVIPFTATNRKMSVRVYSPDAGIQIRLKAEVHGQPTQSVETEATTTTSNAWETLVFDFNNQAAGTAAFNATYPYDMASIFFDFGTVGAAKTYYFDDVMMDTTGGGTGPVLSQIDLTVTFEDTTVNYAMTDFGGNVTVLAADPVNATNTVAKTTKTTGAQTWAGTTIGTNLGFANVIPFTPTERRMTVYVYSPDAGIPVRLKVEVHGQSTQSVETEAITTLANTWEALVFDFDNEAPGTAAFNPAFPYDMASIFFDFGAAGSGKTYYFDDVQFGAVIAVENPLASAVSLYPNPVANILTIKLPQELNTQNLNYVITDMTGRKVLNGALEKGQIEVNSLSNGIYSLQITTTNGVINKRFVKQ